MKKTIDIVIPSVNAYQLLKKNLPQVLKNSKEVENIIIVDDGSTDQTEKIKSLSPKIKIIKNIKNLGFPKAVNQGFKASKSDLVVLLNNDVLPRKDYIKNSLKYFTGKNTFAVTFNEKHSSWPNVSWEGGKYQYTQGKDKTKAIYSPWASGGSAIFNNKIWKDLGGFNEIYSPGYWEDIDISWRAWKQGFKIIWEPKAKVFHQHESTFKKLDQNYINLVKQRNELLFIWQNFSDLKLWLTHIWFLITHTLKHPGYIKVIIASLLSLPKSKRIKNSKLTDIQVLSLFNKKA